MGFLQNERNNSHSRNTVGSQLSNREMLAQLEKVTAAFRGRAQNAMRMASNDRLFSQGRHSLSDGMEALRFNSVSCEKGDVHTTGAEDDRKRVTTIRLPRSG
jgi:hypothetical protein